MRGRVQFRVGPFMLSGVGWLLAGLVLVLCCWGGTIVGGGPS